MMVLQKEEKNIYIYIYKYKRLIKINKVQRFEETQL